MNKRIEISLIVLHFVFRFYGSGSCYHRGFQIKYSTIKCDADTNRTCIIGKEHNRTIECTCTLTGLSKKVPAKFSDTCSVRADGLCIGCLDYGQE